MKYDLAIKNGSIVTSKEIMRANVYTRNGVISVITEADYAADNEIDATDLCILPGVIDAHVHYREPGMTEKNDFFHGSMSSAIGGCTTVFDMPNTIPLVDTAEHVRYKLHAIEGKSFVDYCLWGIIVGNDISRIKELYDSGIVAYKIFLGSSSGLVASPEEGALYDAMCEIAKTGLIVGFHAEDRGFSEYYEKLFKEQGRGKYQDFEIARSKISEALAIARLATLTRYSKARSHILHLSSKDGLDICRAAQREGITLTAETCPQYLFLKSGDYKKLGNYMKAQPPVRESEDQDAMIEGMLDGSIQLVCSDSAPQLTELKRDDMMFWEIPSGIDLSEYMVSIMLTLVNKGKMSLEDYVRVSSENPAKLYGIYPKKGAMLPGSDADFTIVDMNKNITLREEDAHGKQHFNLLKGWKLKGVPVYTILRGKVVVDHGKVAEEPEGVFLNPREYETPNVT